MPFSSAWSDNLGICLRLARTEGVGPRTYKKLMHKFSTPEEALEALPILSQRSGRTPPVIPSQDIIEKEIEHTYKMGGCLIPLGHADYPALLQEINDPPAVISLLGNTGLLNQNIIGMVGARNASAGGLKLAHTLAASLAQENIIIISGLARGIDGAAHKAALHHGATIAALAGGLDCFYPPEHRILQKDIAEKGLLITEAPLGTAPLSQHFPRRNRLIAGLALGCVILEAAQKSGSLITARLCLDYQRMVFAVPGFPLDPRSAGANALLRDGAILTETAEDILRELQIPSRHPATRLVPQAISSMNPQKTSPENASLKLDNALYTLPSSPESKPDHATDTPIKKISQNFSEQPSPSLNTCQKTLVSLLSSLPMPADELIRLCKEPAHIINIALAELELAGHIELRPEGYILLQG